MARRRNLALLAVAALGLACPPAEAANASEPHPHKGLIPVLKMDGKPKVRLSGKDMERIEAGQLWTRTREADGTGYGTGIQLVAAPPSVVFAQIADLKGYVGKVPMLRSLNVYSRKEERAPLGSGRKRIVVEKATYVVRPVPGLTYEYYLEHRALEPVALTFSLDYSRNGDFNDMQGKWFLEEAPEKPGWTTVYYECNLKLFGSVPTVVKNLLTRGGITSAIGWVKRESEKAAARSKSPVTKVVASAFVGGGGAPPGPIGGGDGGSRWQPLPQRPGPLPLESSPEAPGRLAAEGYLSVQCLAALAAAAAATMASRRLLPHRTSSRGAARARGRH